LCRLKKVEDKVLKLQFVLLVKGLQPGDAKVSRELREEKGCSGLHLLRALGKKVGLNEVLKEANQ